MQHRVEPRPGDPAHEFTPPLAVEDFEAQLSWLVRHARVVPADRVQAEAASRRRGAPFPIAITFDDDTTSHVAYALPVLRRRGLPATFFLNGIALGAPRRYWWELLQAGRAEGWAWSSLIPAASLRAAQASTGDAVGPYEVSVAVQEMDPEDRRAMAADLQERFGTSAPAGLGAPEIRMLDDGTRSVGWHGYRHEPLSLLTPEALAAELDDGRRALEEVLGRTMRSIAYPYGRADQTTADAARERGFTTGFTTVPEAVRPSDDPLLLGRIDGCTPTTGAFAVAVATAILRG
ncbi:polysaccharide deacetylase family protein [Svornostia abyssi]|uniref:Polysaccharide deacetylase family protein n=1 Tax=Svornostia abyssi TaxID=2898438 RepID=A0ABY5PEV8_9ACTN|nr:polysaccharide deacetylase family protein [Parviterribacteraceae bacterium J379]